MGYKPEHFCSKDENGFNILEVGKLIKFDDSIYEILEISQRDSSVLDRVKLMGLKVVALNLRTRQKEYFLDHDLI